MKFLARILAPSAAFLLCATTCFWCMQRFDWWIALIAGWFMGLTGAFLFRCTFKRYSIHSVRSFLLEWVYDGLANVFTLGLMALTLLPQFGAYPWVRIPGAALLCALGTLFFPPLLYGPLSRLRRVLNEEAVSYLVFGVLTTVVNIAAFWVLCDRLYITELVANVIAWAISVAFAYVTNRLFVFESRASGMAAVLRELGLFVGARLLSLGLDEVGMYVCLYVLSWNKMVAKVLMNGLVIIFNYFASKLLIFRKAEKKEGPHS